MEWNRAITEKDVLEFAKLSGDEGSHHLQKDSRGRLMAHGLLTATLPTKLGGDLNFIADSMIFDFIRPVHSGDTLTCRGTVDSVVPKPRHLKVAFSFSITNQDGRAVLKGSSTGLIKKQ
ncbi:MAG: hypothetical protein HY611_10390 [Elusimicrobia bacterium]|nr:hypothetical protein [Elusimicrobiota bacterium]